MANQWIKLYTEILHDRKFRKMSERQQLVCLKLFLLAGQEDQNGDLPPIEDISLELYMPNMKQLRGDLDRLVELQILDYDNVRDLWTVINYQKRQESNLTGYERVKRYRENRKVINDNADDNGAEVINDNAMITPMITRENNGKVINDKEMITVEKEIDIEEEKEEEKRLINTAAAAAANAKTQKPKYTPDQPEFWKCAFGPEADRAQSFSQASGIVPVKTEFGRWQKDLRALTEAGIETPVMMRAVTEMRARHLTIKAPGSVLTVARELLIGPRSQKSTEEILAEVELEGLDE